MFDIHSDCPHITRRQTIARIFHHRPKHNKLTALSALTRRQRWPNDSQICSQMPRHRDESPNSPTSKFISPVSTTLDFCERTHGITHHPMRPIARRVHRRCTGKSSLYSWVSPVRTTWACNTIRMCQRSKTVCSSQCSRIIGWQSTIWRIHIR